MNSIIIVNSQFNEIFWARDKEILIQSLMTQTEEKVS